MLGVSGRSTAQNQTSVKNKVKSPVRVTFNGRSSKRVKCGQDQITEGAQRNTRGGGRSSPSLLGSVLLDVFGTNGSDVETEGWELHGLQSAVVRGRTANKKPKST